MKSKPLILAALALASTLVTGAAMARSNVYWSIGINAPLDYGVSLGTVISNAPAYPVYQPAPVYYSAPPVYVRPAPVYYYAAPRPVYLERPVIYQPMYVPVRHEKHWKSQPRHRRDGWRDRDRDDDDDGYRYRERRGYGPVSYPGYRGRDD